MKWILLSFFLFLLNAVQAQTFPQQFVGNWKGEIAWYKPGSKQPQMVAAQLRVQPTDTIGQYTWQIIYGEAENDNRPYILKPADTAKGHWVIDERNGIVLDQYWLGNKFSGAFHIDPVTIVNSYWIEGNQLQIEFQTIATKSANKTGRGTEDAPSVDSYRISGYQRGVLRKVK